MSRRHGKTSLTSQKEFIRRENWYGPKSALDSFAELLVVKLDEFTTPPTQKARSASGNSKGKTANVGDKRLQRLESIHQNTTSLRVGEGKRIRLRPTHPNRSPEARPKSRPSNPELNFSISDLKASQSDSDDLPEPSGLMRTKHVLENASSEMRSVENNTIKGNTHCSYPSPIRGKRTRFAPSTSFEDEETPKKKRRLDSSPYPDTINTSLFLANPSPSSNNENEHEAESIDDVDFFGLDAHMLDVELPQPGCELLDQDTALDRSRNAADLQEFDLGQTNEGEDTEERITGSPKKEHLKDTDDDDLDDFEDWLNSGAVNII